LNHQARGRIDHLKDPMGNKLTPIFVQNDVSDGKIASAYRFHERRVPRPDCWKHAPSRDPEWQTPGPTQRIASQFPLDGVRVGTTPRSRLHDALVLVHVLWVIEIFPHERAVVTNTCSKRNDGFSYGFFGVSVRGFSEGESFIAIKGTYQCLFL
jgi:hypothetical protein